MKSLGMLDKEENVSIAKEINDAGQIIGESIFENWEKEILNSILLYMNGVIYELNALVVSGKQRLLTRAVEINAAGQILAKDCSQNCEIYRLDPLTAARVISDRITLRRLRPLLPHRRRSRDSHAGRQRLGLASHRRRVRRGCHGADVDQPGNVASSARRSRRKARTFTRAEPSECEAVKANARWKYEGKVFYAVLPDAAGACSDGRQPVYRLYNSG